MGSFLRFEFDDEYLSWMKQFMIWYGWFFVGLIILSITVSGPAVSAGIYFVTISACIATLLLIKMPLKCLKKILLLTVPGYILFTHLFFYFTGKAGSAYLPVYYLPITLASFLFSFPIPLIAILLTLISRMLLDMHGMHLSLDVVIGYFPFFAIATLLAVMGSFISSTLIEWKQNLSDLFSKVERAKKEWEGSLDAIDDMISICDIKNRIVRVNMTVARKLNRNISDIVGKGFEEVFINPDDARIMGRYNFIHIERPPSNYIEELFQGGTFEVHRYPLEDEKGETSGFINFMKDVTASIKNENALKRELLVAQTLYKTERIILSLTDGREVSRMCVDGLRELIDVEYISVAKFRPDENIFSIEACLFKGKYIGCDEAIVFDSSFLKKIVTSGLSRQILTPDEIPGCSSDFREKGLRSILIVPMIANGEAVGLLTLGSAAHGRFHKEDIELAEKYAFHISLAMDNMSLHGRFENLFMDTVVSISSAVDSRSVWTRNHSDRVSEYADGIAASLGLDNQFRNSLKVAVLLHDIGKININDSILNKSNPLTGEEREMILNHPMKGVSILEPIRDMKNIIPIVRHHHENWNGTGYPDRLSGNMIPLGARIVSVADAYDSMTSDRPYRKGFSHEDAVKELRRCAGIQFDPQVVDAFINHLSSEMMNDVLMKDEPS